MSTTWTTQDGRVLEIKWMDSIHLVHSVNMLMRKNSLNHLDLVKSLIMADKSFGPMLQELKDRKLYAYDKLATPAQFTVPTHRESPIEMCMLRALIDTGIDDRIVRADPTFGWKVFRNNPEAHRNLVAGAASVSPACVVAELWVKFVEYRFEHG